MRKVVQCVHLQQTLSILIHFSTFMPFYTDRSGLVISTNSDIEVAKQQQLFMTEDPACDCMQLVVEFVLASCEELRVEA